MPPSKVPPDPDRKGGRGHRTGEFRDGVHARKPVGEKGAEYNPRLEIEGMRQPVWEIQPGEGQIPYEHFKVYRDLGYQRTQKLVVEIKAPRSPNALLVSLSQWSSQWSWVARARAYDAWLDTINLGQQEKAIRARTQQWVAREDAIRELEYSIAAGLGEKILEMLKHPITKVTRTKQAQDGKVVYLTVIEPARWDWRSIGDMLARLSYAARLSAGMVTDGARALTPDPTGRTTSDVDAWLNELGVRVGAE